MVKGKCTKRIHSGISNIHPDGINCCDSLEQNCVIGLALWKIGLAIFFEISARRNVRKSDHHGWVKFRSESNGEGLESQKECTEHPEMTQGRRLIVRPKIKTLKFQRGEKLHHNYRL